MTQEIWLDARQFPSLQTAVDALLAKGGELFIPAGTYHLAEPLRVEKPNVTIRGEGPGSVVHMTDGRCPALQVEASHFSLRDVRVEGGSHAIQFDAGAGHPTVTDCAFAPASPEQVSASPMSME